MIEIQGCVITEKYKPVSLSVCGSFSIDYLLRGLKCFTNVSSAVHFSQCSGVLLCKCFVLWWDFRLIYVNMARTLAL